MNRYFTSESVSSGHPDKVADQISDSILDEIIKQDPKAHVACETLVTTGLAVVSGEISTSAWVDIQKILEPFQCRVRIHSHFTERPQDQIRKTKFQYSPTASCF